MAILKRKTTIWLLIGLGVLFMAAANSHLVYVAARSQPDCVAHVRAGEGPATQGRFSAAMSSCSPN